MKNLSQKAYADAYYDIPGGVFALDAYQLGRGYQDGDPISVWPDKLGRGYAYQNTLANMPTFASDVGNGRPAVDFNGAQHLVGDDLFKGLMPLYNDFELYVVFGSAGSFTRPVIMWGIAQTSNPAAYGVATLGTSNISFWVASVTVLLGGAGSWPRPTIAIFRGQGTSTSRTIWRNGTQLITGAAGSEPPPMSSPVGIGARLNADGTPFAERLIGPIHEILGYLGTHTQRQASIITSTLADKWGITL
jgi:hypothetical protein